MLIVPEGTSPSRGPSYEQDASKTALILIVSLSVCFFFC